MIINPLKHLREFFLVNVFIINLFISSISNYTPQSYILKAASIIVLYCFLFITAQKYELKILKIIFDKNTKLFLLIIISLVLFPALTLLYSSNPMFGILKLTNLVISTILAILTLYFLLEIKTFNWLPVLFASAFLWGITSTALIIITEPFLYSTVYVFEFNRWSHVILGRLLGSLLIITVIYSLHQKQLRNIVLSCILNVCLIYGLYLTGLRAALLGIIIVIPAILIYSYFDERINKLSRYGLILVIITTALIIVLFSPNENVLEKRYSNITELGRTGFSEDLSFNARKEALLISWKMFLEKPLFGRGLGGFRIYYNSDLPLILKYPHNIILEILVEFGITGLIFYIFIFYLIYNHTFRISPYLTFFFIFAFWLALFSKDLSTQTLLFIGLAFIRKH